jgi:xylulose-5-phosphate/fructose-6-phosphate phosphoketolase
LDLIFSDYFSRQEPGAFALLTDAVHLTYRRNGHHNIHVRGYKEEGTTTTPFDMCVLNDLDGRTPPTPSRRYATGSLTTISIRARYARDHRWTWGQEAASAAVRSTEADNV